MRIGLLLLLWVLPSMVGGQRPAPPSQPSVELPAELDRVLRDYEKAWRARDAQALADLFVDGEIVMTNTGAQVRGRRAVRAVYDGSGGGLSLRAVGFAVGDAVAHILGSYAMAVGEPDAGVFVLALRRGADGRWLISADLDRSIRR